MVYDEIIKKDKEINFKAIGKCNELNYAFISDKVKCEFMFIDVKEKKMSYTLIFIHTITDLVKIY